ncbi:polysaccharide deacetylase family protein [Natrialbaceae archaeon GCM10025810]|uniref:polysaccharide deacetylase family protein n=1 Tax=Halovalidus salilacus TaxID=3075124 RepID=UPI003610C3D4
MNIGNVNNIEINRLITGKYEAELTDALNLRHEVVPDYGYNILNRRGLLYTPIVDTHFSYKFNERPKWPGGNEFAVCLTHDVDHVSALSVRPGFRKAMTRAKARYHADETYRSHVDEPGIIGAAKGVADAFLSAATSITSWNADPYHQFDRWLEIEAQYDATSTFFFLPNEWGRSHISDHGYRHSDTVRFDGIAMTIAGMMCEINARGWEIGLHPTWYSYDDPHELEHQKKQLESVVGEDIRSVRQHYLHFDPRETPLAQDIAGFEFDSTIGFNSNIGFRYGSSYPWNLYDLRNGQRLDLVEIPLSIQDVALFRPKGLNLTPDHAIEYIKQLGEAVRKTGGVLTLSWHPHTIAWDDWWETYQRALEELDKLGAWFGSVAEVGEQWKQVQPESWSY